jgi:hypothetical protein
VRGASFCARAHLLRSSSLFVSPRVDCARSGALIVQRWFVLSTRGLIK